MTDSSRVRMGYGEEAVPGTTPAIANGNFRSIRETSDGLIFEVSSDVSQEVQPDGNIRDLILLSGRSRGPLAFELSHPTPRTFLADALSAALRTNWSGVPYKENLTADSAITDVASATGTYSIDAQPTVPFIAGHMVQATGFTNAANNQVFRATSVTSTTVVGGASTVNETAPPFGAILKAVGWRGASADISLSTTGLLTGAQCKVVSATVDWNAAGIVIGSWVKVSGFTDTANGNVGGNNVWGKVVGFSGSGNKELNLSNCHFTTAAGVTTDVTPVAEVATGKTVTVWFGDRIRNGTTNRSFFIEKGYMGQATPSYHVYNGLRFGGLTLNQSAGQKVTGSFDLLGMNSTSSTTALGTPAAASTDDIFNAVSDLQRIAEAGSNHSMPNSYNQLNIAISNGLREQTAMGSFSAVGVGLGRFTVRLTGQAYFGSLALYNKFRNQTVTEYSQRYARGSKAMVLTFPRVELAKADTPTPGNDQDIWVQFEAQATYDSVTQCTMQVDRFDYFE